MTRNPRSHEHLMQQMRSYLTTQYGGVFGEDPAQFRRLFAETLERSTVHELLRTVLHSLEYKSSEPTLAKYKSKPRRLLDVGCGFGTFSSVAQGRGILVTGIDTDTIAISFARKRVRGMLSRPLFRRGDAMRIPFPAAQFDIVTCWNLLEHVPDYSRVIREAYRVLKPGGSLFILCPNYLAIRREAHYHLWLPPLVPKLLAAYYLRLRSRDPTFFIRNIHYCTNNGVLRTLQQIGFVTQCTSDALAIRFARARKCHPFLGTVVLRAPFLSQAIAKLYFFNPFKSAIALHAVKPHV